MIEWIDPNELKNHPSNLATYGDTPDPTLIESVRQFGVFEDHPIGYVVNGDGKTIVSGFRRNQAARITKKSRVPCIRLTEIEGDDEAVKERIVLSNRHRNKTTEQMAREAALLAEVESVRAKQRQNSSLKVGAGSPSVSRDTNGEGRTREKVADALGVSEATAQRLVTAGTALVSAERRGNKAEAKKIKTALATGATAGAMAAAPKPRKNGQPTRAVFAEKTIDEPYGKLLRAIDARTKAFPTDGRYKQVRALMGQLHKAIEEWRR